MRILVVNVWAVICSLAVYMVSRNVFRTVYGVRTCVIHYSVFCPLSVLFEVVNVRPLVLKPAQDGGQSARLMAETRPLRVDRLANRQQYVTESARPRS